MCPKVAVSVQFAPGGENSTIAGEKSYIPFFALLRPDKLQSLLATT